MQVQPLGVGTTARSRYRPRPLRVRRCRRAPASRAHCSARRRSACALKWSSMAAPPARKRSNTSPPRPTTQDRPTEDQTRIAPRRPNRGTRTPALPERLNALTWSERRGDRATRCASPARPQSRSQPTPRRRAALVMVSCVVKVLETTHDQGSPPGRGRRRAKDISAGSTFAANRTSMVRSTSAGAKPPTPTAARSPSRRCLCGPTLRNGLPVAPLSASERIAVRERRHPLTHGVDLGRHRLALSLRNPSPRARAAPCAAPPDPPRAFTVSPPNSRARAASMFAGLGQSHGGLRLRKRPGLLGKVELQPGARQAEPRQPVRLGVEQREGDAAPLGGGGRGSAKRPRRRSGLASAPPSKLRPSRRSYTSRYNRRGLEIGVATGRPALRSASASAT